MKVTAESYGRAIILNVAGELTEDSLKAFRETVEQQHKGDEIVDLVLNMEELQFIDSAAIEYLLDLRDSLVQKMCRLWLVKPGENLRQILRITRLETSFEIFADIPEAIRSIQA